MPLVAWMSDGNFLNLYFSQSGVISIIQNDKQERSTYFVINIFKTNQRLIIYL